METKNLDHMIRETVKKYMKRPLIVAGNWKMNMTICEGLDFIDKIGSVEDGVIIFPPYTTLTALASRFQKNNILYGPQNFHAQDQGAYTGEISIPMIQELGCGVLLVGHSERRNYYNETDEELCRKVAKGVRSGFRVMLCIGENLEERKTGSWQKVLAEQLAWDLMDLKLEELDMVMIAYEPVWAIGTGVSASITEIRETHSFLKLFMKKMFGRELPILYGGSVNEKNAFDIGSCPEVDGFLIGGASLKPDKFKKIIEISKRV